MSIKRLGIAFIIFLVDDLMGDECGWQALVLQLVFVPPFS